MDYNGNNENQWKLNIIKPGVLYYVAAGWFNF
jgi:hypothetical protein